MFKQMTLFKLTSDLTHIPHSTIECDEIKVFECDKHADDIDTDENFNRFSPIIKDEDSLLQNISSTNISDRLQNEQPFHPYLPYSLSPYYHSINASYSSNKTNTYESLSKFISPLPVHLPNSNRNVDHNDRSNSIYPLPQSISFQKPYSEPWRSSVFPFIFPNNYSFLPNTSFKDSLDDQQQTIIKSAYKCSSSSHKINKQKKIHIKKPLNAFMLFMKEQRAQVVQECTLRESAAINQILGRKWHELDRHVQQKYYDMARDERMKHMQLYPGWSARDNYGVKKKRMVKTNKRDRQQRDNPVECLNQKKCRARFGLDQQANWCKHCKRKKKCLRYTENETTSMNITSWSEDDDTDNMDNSNDCDNIMLCEGKNETSIDYQEKNKINLLKFHRQLTENDSHLQTYLPATYNKYKDEL